MDNKNNMDECMWMIIKYSESDRLPVKEMFCI